MICAISAVAIAYATLRPEGGTSTADHLCIVCGDAGVADAILNVALFAPLGIGLALAGVSLRRALLSALCATVTIELAQYFLIPGRDAVAGDVVANTLGGLAGFLIGSRWRLLVRPTPGVGGRLTLGWGAGWLLVQAISSAALVPTPTRSVYYGQIAHDFPHREQFTGSVTSFRVGRIEVPEGRLADAEPVAGAIRAHDAVTTTATIPVATTRLAPIVGVMDREHRSIAMIGQRGTGMAYSVRTMAAPMRLRPPAFLLDSAFTGATSAASPVRMSGQWRARSVELAASTGGRTVEATFPLSPALGWTLLVPFEYFVVGSAADRLASLAWVGILVVPLGFWGRRSLGGREILPTRTLAARGVGRAVVLLSVVAVGLAGVPLMFGIAPASLAAFGAAVAALASGIILGSA